MSLYKDPIARLAPKHDPRHIEAWMRVEHSTLDWMSRDRFADEVAIAVGCIAEATAEQSEALARSYGL